MTPAFVDILVLGAGWTFDFLEPQLKVAGISYAATSTTGRDGTIPFRFDADSDDVSEYETLPDCRTAVIVFPIRGSGGSKRLVNLYKRAHPSTKAGFLQLGSTGIYDNGPTFAFEWTTRHSAYNTSNERAIAEDELLECSSHHNPTCVLELCGLHGGKRNVRNFVSRIAPDKPTLAKKATLHMIHGDDVAQLIVGLHKAWDKAAGQRWLATDLRVYDLWEIASRFGEGGTDGRDKPVTGPQKDWVRELMVEQNVHALPRTPEQLGRAMTSVELWQSLNLSPKRPVCQSCLASAASCFLPTCLPVQAMPARRKPTPNQIKGFQTVRLPAQLEQELKDAGQLPANFKARFADRKERRKAERASKSQRRKQYGERNGRAKDAAKVNGSNKKRPAERQDTEDDRPPAKKQKIAKDLSTSASLQIPVVDDKGKKTTPLEKMLAQQQGRQSATSSFPKNKSRTAAEQQEDKEIAWLEQQLNSKGNWQDELEEEGLDDLFSDLDRIDAALLDGIDTKHDFKRMSESSDSDDEEEDSFDDDTHGSDDLSDDHDFSALAQQDSGEEDQDEWTGIASENEAELPKIEERSRKSVRFASPQSPVERKEQKAQEISKPDASSRTAYVPPHLRSRQELPDDKEATVKTVHEEDDLKDARLDRLVSSNLNKLSPANVKPILQICQRDIINGGQYSRAMVTASMVRLLLDRIAITEVQGDVGLLTLAAFTSLIDSDGTSIREGLMAETLRAWDAPLSDESSKTRSNIVNFWAKLYTLGTLGCRFIYGIVNDLISESLEDSVVEQLLVLFKNAGQKLRLDDPSALKQIVQLVEEKRNAGSDSLSSRAKFMIETLVNLKNNKVKNDPNSATAETENNLKKMMKSSRHDMLQFTPEDLREAGRRGKWWRTGAAWAGDALIESRGKLQNVSNDLSNGNDDVWLKLARKQGMNTDVRREIFVALMGSEDYVDACARLTQLKLKEIQQREIVKVLLHCCSNEKAYNPFYAMVLHRLLTYDPTTSHSFVITSQYSLWDFFRRLGETEVGGSKRLESEDSRVVDHASPRQASNMARLFGWLVGKGALPITVLRPVPFATVGKQAQAFLKQLLNATLVFTQSSSPLETSTKSVVDKEAITQVFNKANRAPALVEGLAFFFDAYMQNSDNLAPTLLRLAKEAMDGRGSMGIDPAFMEDAV